MTGWFTQAPSRLRKYGTGWWALIRINAAGIPSAEALGVPLIGRDEHIAGAGGIVSAEALGLPVLTRGGVSLAPAGIASAEAVGAPVLTPKYTIAPTGIPTAANVRSPVISVGPVAIVPEGIVSEEAFGVFWIETASIFPNGIPSAQAFGSPAIVPGGVNISPLGIDTNDPLGGVGFLENPSFWTLDNHHFFDSSISTDGQHSLRMEPGESNDTTELNFFIPTTPGEVIIWRYNVIKTEDFDGTSSWSKLRFSNGDTNAYIAANSYAGGGAAVDVWTEKAQWLTIPEDCYNLRVQFCSDHNNGLVWVDGLYADQSKVGVPEIIVGVTGIYPLSIPSAEALGSPSIVPGGINFSPTGIPTAQALGTPSILRGAVFITPNGIVTAETLGAPALSVGPVSIFPDGIESEEAFGENTGVTASPPQFITDVFGITHDTNLALDPSCENPALWASNSVSGATVEVTTEAAYEGTGCVKVVRTDVSWCTITPIRNPNNGNNAHNYEIIPGQKVRISGRMAPVPSSTDETFYARCFVRFRDENNAIISGFAQYDTALMTTAEPEWYLLEAEAITPENAVWIDTGFYMNNTESVGNGYYLDDVVYEKQTVMEPTISTGGVDVAPTGIPTAESVGDPAISVGTVEITPAGIASAEAFGPPTITTGGVTITMSAIPSAESHGSPVITTGVVSVAPTGIATAEALGTPAILRGAVNLAPSGIATAEGVGSPAISVGAVNVSPGGIASGEAFGNPTVVAIPPPLYERNVARSNYAVPAGYSEYRVRLRGAGGGGGGARSASFASNAGGGGGGGGAYIDTGWRPIAELGSTYSMIRGTGGNGSTNSADGENGGSSRFDSAAWFLVAGGGSGGQTRYDSITANGGAGGTPTGSNNPSVSAAEAGAVGGQGGEGSSSNHGRPGGNSNLAGPGGGGGVYHQNNFNSNSGGDGGSSTHSAGGLHVDYENGLPGANGGDGQAGGGGAGGSKNSNSPRSGGNGGSSGAGGGGASGGSGSSGSTNGGNGAVGETIFELR